MDPFNINELASTIVSQAHEHRRDIEAIRVLTDENNQLRRMIEDLTPQDPDHPEGEALQVVDPGATVDGG